MTIAVKNLTIDAKTDKPVMVVRAQYSEPPSPDFNFGAVPVVEKSEVVVAMKFVVCQDAVLQDFEYSETIQTWISSVIEDRGYHCQMNYGLASNGRSRIKQAEKIQVLSPEEVGGLEKVQQRLETSA